MAGVSPSKFSLERTAIYICLGGVKNYHFSRPFKHFILLKNSFIVQNYQINNAIRSALGLVFYCIFQFENDKDFNLGILKPVILYPIMI